MSSSVDQLTGTGDEYRPAGALTDFDEALAQYKGPWNPRLAAHLLRRAGFGGSPSDIASATSAGMDATVQRLIHFGSDSLPAAPDGDISFDFSPTADQKQRQRSFLATQMWFVNRCLQTPNPLRERMVYFWSNHFTSGLGQDGITPQQMVDQYNLFARYALGNYAELTHEISKDGAMLLYLNNAQNRQAHPNENYARELMELFTMGVGNYSEQDVRESARAFTGWTVLRRQGDAVTFNPQLHDNGTKTFLGRTGNFMGDDIVDIIMQQGATPRYMANKFARNFIYDNPEPGLIDALATRLRAANYDVARLMGVILRSNLFYSDRAYRALVKSPLELVIGAHKALGATNVEPLALNAMRQMNQIAMQPPNVAGWPGGAMWLNTGTLLARINYLNQLALSKGVGQNAAMTGGDQMMAMVENPAAAMRMGANVADPTQWIAGVNMGDAGAVTDRVLWMAVQDDATAQQRQTILSYLSTDDAGMHAALTMENVDEKVRGAMSLAFALPSFQLA
ncbi:MAG: DUF1800 domain-containing protein [Candidatus Eremiobacteraeota bacterium]|nr:DUF1800 domain-containing protein [Candidatus Eremiobacteraeota bacterium]MBV8365426.1 DUF1800 domain-containing protein [Candidatus Eremiobacteraeota bacterium]